MEEHYIPYFSANLVLSSGFGLCENLLLIMLKRDFMKRIKDQGSKLGKEFFILYLLGVGKGLGLLGGWGEKRREESRGEREKGERKALFELLLMSLESFPRYNPPLESGLYYVRKQI